MGAYVIQTEKLQKKYGKKWALQGLDLQLEENQIIGLIGANGSGKTTRMKLLVGQEDKSGGTIRVLGGDPAREVAISAQMIYAMHDLPVCPTEKLYRILSYYAIAFPKFDLVFAEKMVDIFGIQP